MAIRYLSGINVDSNTLFVDDANNRVGIGTGSPVSPLDVNGIISSRGIFIAQNSGTYNLLYNASNSVSMYLGGSADPGNYYDNTTHYFRSSGGGTTYAVINYLGNVGIGTTSPVYPLDLGTGGTGNSIRARRIWASGTGTDSGFSLNSTLIYEGASNSFNITNPGSYPNVAFTINNVGNVGIGTTSPANTLQIGSVGATGYSGNRLAVGDGTNVVALHPGAVSYLTANGDIVVGAGGNTTNQVYVKSGGNVGIGTTSPNQKLHVVGNTTITGVTYTDIVQTYSGASIDFRHQDASVVMRVDTANARVGIGTTSPSYKLDVSGDIRSTTIDLNTQGVNVSSYGFLSQTLSGQMTFLGHNVRASSTVNNTALVVNGGWISSLIKQYYNEGITFHTSTTEYAAGATYPLADTERMRITSAGNVGIGTTSPAYKLDVNGATQIQNELILSTNDAAFRLYRTTGINYFDWSSGQDLRFSTVTTIGGAGRSTAVTFLSDGNVGIGTTSPSEKLDVYGAIKLSGQVANVVTNGIVHHTNGYVYFTGGTAGAAMGNDSYSSAIYAVDNGSLELYAGSSNRLHITSAGNVGIGTTSPSQKLDVVGNAKISADILLGTAGVSNNIYFADATSTQNVRINSYTDNTLFFDNFNGQYNFRTTDSYVSRLYIANGGNVGIGTTAPNEKLHVAGNIHAYAPSGIDAGLFSSTAAGSTTIAIRSSGITHFNGGNVGIGTTSPAYKLQVDGPTGVRNGSFYIGDESGSTNSAVEFYKSGTTIRMYTNTGAFGGTYGATSASLTLYSGSAYSTLINGNGDSYFGTGNLGIGTTSPATKLHVVGYSRNDGGLLLNGSDADYREIIFTTSAASRWNLYAYGGESGSNAGSVLYLARYADNGDYIANVATFLRTNGYVGIATTTPTQQLHVSGNIRVTGAYYDSNNSAGSSGQVLSSTGSGTDWVNLSEITGVDGTGTANYIAKWSDTDTITNSQVFDNGTNVGINNASPKTRLDINGAIGFGSKSMSMTDTFAAALTINMNDHNGCYVKLTAFGDWANHSTIAYLGEFFIQASEGSYNEPGIIIRQVDNTGGGDDIQAQIVDPAGTGTRDFVIQLKATSASNTPFTAHLQYEVRGLYNSVS